MKKTNILLGAVMGIASALTFTSCHDEQPLTGGEGLVRIQASINTDVRVKSRANADELAEKCLIHIYNKKGLVRRFNGISSLPAQGFSLVADHYIAEAWTGDSVSASFDDRYFKGREEFDVINRQTADVNLACKIANVVTAVEYDETVDEFLKEYTLTVGHSRGTLDFEGRDDRWGYFMMPKADKDLTWTLNATLGNGEKYTRQGTIAGAKPTTLYTIKIGYTDPGKDPFGGGFVTIEVDETALEVTNEIEISIAPLITGRNFNIDEAIIAETGNVGRRSVIISATSALTDVILQSESLSELTGVDGNDFNLMNLSESIQADLEAAGLNWIYSYDDENDISAMKINFEESFTNRLEAAEYAFNITATDALNKTTRKTLNINCSNAPVLPNEPVTYDVWATKATLVGTLLKDDAETPGFAYRMRGIQAWTPVNDVTVNGSTYTAVVNGLTPGTEYEYIATAADYESSAIVTFTTESAPQLPNASFEDWHSGKTDIDTKNLDLIFAAGGQMFWDSGNHGSITMNKNVTTRSTEKAHAGEASAKLASQFVGVATIGKLAAGNIFIGQYLGTEGTDGVLGWGRPWASRPQAVTAWVHYTPVAVTHASTNPGNVAKGDMDTAILYVAILDDSYQSYTKNGVTRTAPVIVNTGTKQFFSKDDPNVIAYGEVVLSEATQGDAMVQVTIPLNYVRTDVKASNIMMTASASRYGDYFTGGNGSTLYLDDIQLVY